MENYETVKRRTQGLPALPDAQPSYEEVKASARPSYEEVKANPADYDDSAVNINDWFRSSYGGIRRAGSRLQAQNYADWNSSDLNSLDEYTDSSYAVRAWINRHRNEIGNEAADQALEQLDSQVNALRDVDNALASANIYWSQWDSQEDYDAAQEAQMTSDQLRQKVNELEAQVKAREEQEKEERAPTGLINSLWGTFAREEQQKNMLSDEYQILVKELERVRGLYTQRKQYEDTIPDALKVGAGDSAVVIYDLKPADVFNTVIANDGTSFETDLQKTLFPVSNPDSVEAAAYDYAKQQGNGMLPTQFEGLDFVLRENGYDYYRAKDTGKLYRINYDGHIDGLDESAQQLGLKTTEGVDPLVFRRAEEQGSGQASDDPFAEYVYFANRRVNREDYEKAAQELYQNPTFRFISQIGQSVEDKQNFVPNVTNALINSYQNSDTARLQSAENNPPENLMDAIRAPESSRQSYGIDFFQPLPEAETFGGKAADVFGSIVTNVADAALLSFVTGGTGLGAKAGSFVTNAAGGGTGARFLGKATQTFLNNATEDLILDVTRGVAQGKSAEEIAKDYGTSLLFDAISAGVLEGLPAIFDAIRGTGKGTAEAVESLTEEAAEKAVRDTIDRFGSLEDAAKAIENSRVMPNAVADIMASAGDAAADAVESADDVLSDSRRIWNDISGASEPEVNPVSAVPDAAGEGADAVRRVPAAPEATAVDEALPNPAAGGRIEAQGGDSYGGQVRQTGELGGDGGTVYGGSAGGSRGDTSDRGRTEGSPRKYAETQESFERRTAEVEARSGGTAEGKGYILDRHGNSRIAYRTPDTVDPASPAGRAAQAFEQNGIRAVVTDGPFESNAGGFTTRHTDAVTAPDGSVYIANNAAIEPEHIVPHESVHVLDRTGNSVYDDFYDAMYSYARYDTPEYNNIVALINKWHYNNQLNINDPDSIQPIFTELTAYIHEWLANDPAYARQLFGGMFDDWDAVVAADRALGDALSSLGTARRTTNAAADVLSDEGRAGNAGTYADIISEVGDQRAFRNAYNAIESGDIPLNQAVTVGGRNTTVGEVVDAVEARLPDDADYLERFIRDTDKQSRLLKIDLQKFAAKPGDELDEAAQLALQKYAAERKLEWLKLAPGEDGTKVRGYLQNRLKGEDITSTPELVEVLSGRVDKYTPKADTELLENARKLIDGDEARNSLYNRFMNADSNTLFTDEEVTAAELMAADFIRDGALEEWADLVTGISRSGTAAGRSLRAYGLMQMLTPEGTLKYAQRLMNNAAEEVVGKSGVESVRKMATTLKNESDKLRKVPVNKKTAAAAGIWEQVMEKSGIPANSNLSKRLRKFLRENADKPGLSDDLIEALTRNSDIDAIQNALKRKVKDLTPVEQLDFIETFIRNATDGLDDKSTEKLRRLLRDALKNGESYDSIEDAFQKAAQGLEDADRARLRTIINKFNQNGGDLEAAAEIVRRQRTAKNEDLMRRIFRDKNRSVAERLIAASELNLPESSYFDILKEALGLPVLDAQTSQTLVDLVNQAKNVADGGIEQAELFNEIYRTLGKNVQASNMDKFNNFRKIAMLSNPKTHIKNIVSNAVNIIQRKLTDLFAELLERAKLDPSERTRALGWSFTRHGREIKDTVIDQTKKAMVELSQIGKYDLSDNVIKKASRVYKNRPMEWVRNKIYELLQREDNFFKRLAYRDALGQAMTARGVTEVTPELHQLAMDRALEATFQADNAINDAVNYLKKIRWFGKFVDFTQPFVKTPSNLFVQAIDYSPVKLVSSTVDLVKRSRGIGDPKSMAEILNNYAKGAVGAAEMVASGILLGGTGILKTGYTQNDKDRAMEEMQGKQQYGLQFGDVSVSIDWLQPVAFPIIIGAAIGEGIRNKEDEVGIDLLGPLTNGTDSLFALSMLDGIVDLLGGGSQSPTENLLDNMSGWITQYIPSIVSAGGRVADPVQRKPGNDLIANIQNRLGLGGGVAGLDSVMPELNIWGETVYRTGEDAGFLGNVFQQFLNPSNVKTAMDTDDPVTQAFMELYETADVDQKTKREMVPGTVTEYWLLPDGTRVDKSDVYEQAMRDVGQLQKQAAEDFIIDGDKVQITVGTGRTNAKGEEIKQKKWVSWDTATDEEKIKALGKIFSDVSQEVKDAYEDDTVDRLWEGVLKYG